MLESISRKEGGTREKKSKRKAENEIDTNRM